MSSFSFCVLDFFACALCAAAMRRRTALRRWGLKESDLPPGSIVLFREPSLWERGKNTLVSGLVIIVLLAALTAYLLYNQTQPKLARETQVRLSGLLIDARERERSRLAAELHDDFSQRVALLVFGLRDAQETLSTSSNAANQKLEKLKETVRELGDDLHAIISSTAFGYAGCWGSSPGCVLCAWSLMVVRVSKSLFSPRTFQPILARM